MIHPISTQTAVQAWLAAVNLLAKTDGRCAYNIILDIENPIALPQGDKRIVDALDRFLRSHDTQPVSTVAGTIFPASHYRQRGAKGVLEDFPQKVYPKIKKSWGTYAGRMLVRSTRDGQDTSPLEIVIKKLRQQTSRSGGLRAVYELGMIDVFADLPIYDPDLDARRTLNQPCLAHLSFKVRENKGLMLTALYRNHYYVERALGNLVGLSQLLFFVAKESGLEPRGLVCHSTFARLDFDGGWKVADLNNLIDECNAIANESTEWSANFSSAPAAGQRG